MTKKCYSIEAQPLEELGFWPRPVVPGKKACAVKGWQRPNDQIDPVVRKGWLRTHATCGVGLLMGSPFPDGTRLAALDIDRDEYVPIAKALLRDPPCGRFGSKGAVFFVRVRGELKNKKFRVQAGTKLDGQVAEFLYEKSFCVIPPTIHPNTGAPYRWIGTPLSQIDFQLLPILED